jgi:NAD+ kinase
MSLVAFVVHEGRATAVETAEALRGDLGAASVETRIARGPEDVRDQRPDLVVSVGGDGTFLRAARVAAEADCPVLGVKVGRLGFLTEIEPGPDAIALIRAALDDSAPVEERLAVMAEPADGTTFPAQWAMNEIMVEKWTRHRLVRLAVHVGGEYVTTFSADGVIAATPTGSTAYSLSAGGPIVVPSVDAIVVTAICPHTLAVRPLVLPSQSVVTVEPIPPWTEEVLVSFDGQVSATIQAGERLVARRGEYPVMLVRLGAETFFARLRKKLQWGDLSDRERR